MSNPDSGDGTGDTGDTDGRSGDTGPDASAPPARRPTKDELDRIFGVDPTSTRDDLPDPEPPRSDDSWFLENRPPHHGG